MDRMTKYLGVTVAVAIVVAFVVLSLGGAFGGPSQAADTAVLWKSSSACAGPDVAVLWRDSVSDQYAVLWRDSVDRYAVLWRDSTPDQYAVFWRDSFGV